MASLLAENAYLDAAQILHDDLPAAEFAKFVRDHFEAPHYRASELHDLVIAIDPKIVVTTNFDAIYESRAASGKAAAGYNVCRYYESHLIDDLRSNRRLIIKAHGCITDPAKIVLTRRQYFEARRGYPEFFAALDAIFLTNTLLFIGSGFAGDPDMDLLLQNANISAPSSHQHYALVPAGRHPSVMGAISATHNVRFLTYPAGQHVAVLESLRALKGLVESYRAVSL